MRRLLFPSAVRAVLSHSVIVQEHFGGYESISCGRNFGDQLPFERRPGCRLKLQSTACFDSLAWLATSILQPHCPAPRRERDGERFLSALGLPTSGSYSCHPCHAILAVPLFDTCLR